MQHFMAVAEEKQFTRAAQRVNIVQSALSTSIRLLETELDAQLFVRSTRQVRLTIAGGVFLDKARAALDAVRDARDAAADVRGLKRGTLSIGTYRYCADPSRLSGSPIAHSAVSCAASGGRRSAIAG
jgi:DNA-binding transcriptional LysR family regulator